MADLPEEIVLGPFPIGMNNRAKSWELPEGSVRNLVNTRVDNQGILSRRQGLEKVYSGMNCKDGWDCPNGIFFREGSSIKRFNADNTATTLFEGITGSVCTFEYHNGMVYFSDGVISRKIDSDWNVTRWGLPIPSSPTLSNASGIHGAGNYMGCATFVDADGNESGASDIRECNSSGGVKFTNIPSTTDSQVTGVRLYLTTANGEIMYMVAEVAVGATSYTQSLGTYDDNQHLETEFKIPAPPGRIIREFNGIIYIAAGPIVWYTDPMSYDLVTMTENFLQFPNDVTLMEPVLDGIFFANGNTTEFYAGSGPDSFSPRTVLDYGAVFGTGRKHDNDDRIWFSQKGTVIGTTGGQTRNMQEDNVATETADSGASLVKEEDGIKQFLTSLNNPTTSNLAAKDFINAEIIRKA